MRKRASALNSSRIPLGIERRKDASSSVRVMARMWGKGRKKSVKNTAFLAIPINFRDKTSASLPNSIQTAYIKYFVHENY